MCDTCREYTRGRIEELYDVKELITCMSYNAEISTIDKERILKKLNERIKMLESSLT